MSPLAFCFSSFVTVSLCLFSLLNTSYLPERFTGKKNQKKQGHVYENLWIVSLYFVNLINRLKWIWQLIENLQHCAEVISKINVKLSYFCSLTILKHTLSLCAHVQLVNHHLSDKVDIQVPVCWNWPKLDPKSESKLLVLIISKLHCLVTQPVHKYVSNQIQLTEVLPAPLLRSTMKAFDIQYQDDIHSSNKAFGSCFGAFHTATGATNFTAKISACIKCAIYLF